MGFSMINHPFWVSTIYRNPQFWDEWCRGARQAPAIFQQPFLFGYEPLLRYDAGPALHTCSYSHMGVAMELVTSVHGSEHLKTQPCLVHIRNSCQWMFPRISPPKPLPSAAARLRADMWLPRVLWRLPAGGVWQHGSQVMNHPVGLVWQFYAFLGKIGKIPNSRSIDLRFGSFWDLQFLACLLSTPICVHGSAGLACMWAIDLWSQA